MLEFDGRIGHLKGVESPWGNAGGVVKTTEDVLQMSLTGVGWVEDGSHTEQKRLGNGWNPETKMRDKKDWDFNPEMGEMHNSLGMPGEKMDDVEKEIPERVEIAHAHNKKYVLNIAPVTDKPGEEALDLIKRGYAAGADGVILNAGCPNVYDEEGNPHVILSRSPREFGAVLYHFVDAGLEKPIWVRISPQESYENMQQIAGHIVRSGIVSAVLTPNTWNVPMPVQANGEPLLEVDVPRVGKSGPAMADEAIKETYWAIKALENTKVDVIRSSGIMNARELQLSMELGAVAGAGTTFFYISENGWKEDTDKVLSELADA